MDVFDQRTGRKDSVEDRATCFAMFVATNVVLFYLLFNFLIYPVSLPGLHTAKSGKDSATRDDSSEDSRRQPEVLRDFGLYLRMYSGKSRDYYTMLVPSMKYFWFLPVNLTVVLDDTPEDRLFAENISNSFPFPLICFDKPLDPKYYNNIGHSLQQLSMFYVEGCFTNKYVGFVDSDTFFSTMVTPELMFNGSKPIVLGVYGKNRKDWRNGTTFALGKQEVFRCMSYFPVVVKTKHIIEMRKYMEELHKTHFLKVFSQFSISRTGFSQFNIMCTYIWYFHRDEYHFHAQFHGPGFVWNESYSQPSMQYYNESLTAAMTYPHPRSSIHFRYHRGSRNLPALIRPGICFSGGFELCYDVCDSVNKSSVHKELYMFARLNWLWDRRCLEAHRTHYENVQQRYSEVIKKHISQGCSYLRNTTRLAT